MGYDSETDRINKKKIATYQRLVRALNYEKSVIDTYGAFSIEAEEDEHESAKARRNFNLWAMK
jgi:hypothetical protein